MMHFRKQSIADSVMERISAIAASVRTDAPLPAPRGAATINLERQENGDLLVTKSFENGETELMTISNQQPAIQEATPGFTEIGGAEAKPVGQQLSAGPEGQTIVKAEALGGDSLDALLQ